MKTTITKRILSLFLIFTLMFSISSPVFGQEDITITFDENYDYIVNPEMGATTWAYKTDREIDGSLVFTQESWINLEPTKGNFDFDSFEDENNFDLWLSRDQKYILQFNMDYPDSSRERDIPDWLYLEMVEEAKSNLNTQIEEARLSNNSSLVIQLTIDLNTLNNADQLYENYLNNYDDKLNLPGVGTYYQYGMVTMEGVYMYNGGFSPDYSNEVLIDYHSTFIEALGERYNDPETVYLLLVGSIGHWGEMHTTYLRDSSDYGTYPTKDIENQYFNEIAIHFDNIHVSTRQVREVGVENQFGLFHNAYGSDQQTYDWFLDYVNNGYNDYLTGEYYPAYPDAYLSAPVGGECIYTSDSRYMTDEYISNTIQQIKDTHATYFDGYVGYDTDEVIQNRLDLLSHVGYRFGVEQISFNNSTEANALLDLNADIYNHGSAPIYSDYEMVIQLRDQSGNILTSTNLVNDLNTLLPETDYLVSSQLQIPDLKTGSYELYVGIANTDTGISDITMTINEENLDGFYFVSNINVTGSNIEEPTLTPEPTETPVPTPEVTPEVTPTPEPGVDLSEFRVAIYGSENQYIYPGEGNYKFNAILYTDSGYEYDGLEWSVNGLDGVTIDQTGLTSVVGRINEGLAYLTVSSIEYPEISNTIELTYMYHPDYIDQLQPATPVPTPEPTPEPTPTPTPEPEPTEDLSDYEVYIYGRTTQYIYPQVGEYQFNAILKGDNSEDYNLVWSVSGLRSVRVNSTGLVKVRGRSKEGSATLNVYVEGHPEIYKTIELVFVKHPDYF